MEEMRLGIKKAAVLCLLINEDKILLLKRNKEPHINKYIPVGGKIEPYESPKEAVIRETREETDEHINNFKLCGVMVETSPVNFNWINFIYVSNVNYFTPKICNEGELSWESFSKILELPTPTTDWHIYKYVMENKLFMFNAVYDENLDLQLLEDEMSNIVLYSKK